MADSLETFLAAAPRATMVLVAGDAAALAPPSDATVIVLPEDPEDPEDPGEMDHRREQWDLALVVARDRLGLRDLAASLPSSLDRSGLGRSNSGRSNLG